MGLSVEGRVKGNVQSDSRQIPPSKSWAMKTRYDQLFSNDWVLELNVNKIPYLLPR